MSRPTKPSHTQLSHQIIFRVTAAEYAMLERNAARAGLRPGQLARLLVRRRQTRIVIQTTTRLDPAYIAQIKRIGHNLNLLTKNAMIFKRVSPRVERLCEEIQRIITHAANERVDS